MIWTVQQDAELIRLWPVASASEIAKQLGTTRNAVIGRYHRLKGDYAEYAIIISEAGRAFTKKRRQAVEAKEREIINKMNGQLTSLASRNRAIVEIYQAGVRQKTIAEVLGLSKQRIEQIVSGQKELVSKRREST